MVPAAVLYEQFDAGLRGAAGRGQGRSAARRSRGSHHGTTKRPSAQTPEGDNARKTKEDGGRSRAFAAVGSAIAAPHAADSQGTLVLVGHRAGRLVWIISMDL